MTKFLTLLLIATSWASAGDIFTDLPFEEAKAKAQKENKLFFVDFYTTWCPGCRKHTETTWKDPKVIDWISKNAIAIKVDCDKEHDLVKTYNIQGYPTLAFIDYNGKIKDMRLAYMDPEQFLKFCEDAAKGIKTFQKLLKELESNPSDMELTLKVATAYFDMHMPKEGTPHLKKVVEHLLEKDESYVNRATYLLSRVAAEEAIPLARRGQAKEKKRLEGGEYSKKNLQSLLFYNRALRDHHDSEALDLAAYLRSLKTQGNSEAFMALGKVAKWDLLNAKEFAIVEQISPSKEAIKEIMSWYDTKTESYKKDNPTMLAYRGMQIYKVLMALKRYDEAHALAEQIFAFGTSSQIYRYFAYGGLIAEAKTPQNYAYAKKAHEADPEDIWSLATWLRVMDLHGETQKALNKARASIEEEAEGSDRHKILMDVINDLSKDEKHAKAG